MIVKMSANKLLKYFGYCTWSIVKLKNKIITGYKCLCAGREIIFSESAPHNYSICPKIIHILTAHLAQMCIVQQNQFTKHQIKCPHNLCCMLIARAGFVLPWNLGQLTTCLTFSQVCVFCLAYVVLCLDLYILMY